MTLAMTKLGDSIFQLVLDDHLSRFSSVPSFFIEDTDIIDTMVEEEIVCSVTDAREVLESYYSFETRIINDEWFCTYEPAYEVWQFNRILGPMEYERRQEAELSTLRSKLKSKLFSLTGRQFELLLYDLFYTMPHYQAPIARPMSHDGGYDMDVTFRDPVTNTSDRILIQAKNENKPVSVSHTRELIGTLDIESRRSRNSKRIRGLIISLLPPSVESEKAADASRFSIDFISADTIIDLMIKHNLGCKSKSILKSDFDTTFWNEILGE